MGCGVEAERLGEEECAPIGDATYDTHAGKDKGAGCACDSGGRMKLVGGTGGGSGEEVMAYSFTSASLPGRTWELSVRYD